MKFSPRVKAMMSALVISSFASSLALAGPNRHQAEKILRQNDEERYVIVTGSHIPQRIQLKSIGTETPYNLRIYSRRELDSSGRQTVGGALATLDPSIQLSGH